MTPPSTAKRRVGAPLGAALVALVAPLALATPAHASSTSSEVVFTADADNDGVYSVEIRDMTSRQTRTLLPADATNEWIYDDPELSPDGGRVALSSDRGSTAFDEGIVVVNRDGSGFTRLTEPPSTDTTYSIDVAPAWSPDGRRIAFTRITSDKPDGDAVSTSLFVVDVASRAVTAFAQARDGYTADWSPDGTKVVFAALTPGSDSGPLTVIPADPTATTGRTTLGNAVGLMPAWSPDGATIAYATVTVRDGDRQRAQDTAQIATIPASGGSARVLGPTRPDTSRPTVAEYPAWTPDGEAIVYDLFGYSTADDFPPGDLWAIDKDGVRAGRVMTTPGDEAQAHLQGPAASTVSAGSAATFVPVPPVRILNTRPGSGNVGAPAAKVGPGGVVDLKVHGVQTANGPVPTTATAVVLNVTAVNVSAATDIRVYPTPTDGFVSGSSSLNAAPGQVVPNLVTATLGAGGSVRLRNSSGTVDLVADIAGYYQPASAGGLGYTAVDPGRVLDTRRSGGLVGAGGTVDLPVTGALATTDGRTVNVPADAQAVVLNVTATGATEATDVRVYPRPTSGDDVPTVSNLNVRAGQTAPNLVTVAVQDGQVRLRNQSGQVHLIADIAGYYSAGSTGRFVPVAPLRFLDTRSGTGAAPIATTAGGFVDLRVAGTRGIPAGATAAVLNLTATGVTATTDVRAYPTSASTVPTISNLNLVAGQTRANAAIVKVGGDGRVRVRNQSGALQLIADVAGYMVG